MQAPDAEAVADALARAFSRPEFQERRLWGPLESLAEYWAAAKRWAGEMLDALLSATAGGSRLVTWFLLASLLLAAGAALGYLLARALRRTGPGSTAADASASGAPDAAVWEATAARAREEGRLRDAALALYQAAILRLEERGALRFHAGKTPGDYRRELRPDPSIGPAFDAFVSLLLPLAFAADPPNTERFERLRRVAAGMGVDA